MSGYAQISELLKVRTAGCVMWVTIDHAPVNLLDAELYGELSALATHLHQDTSTHVVVFQSAHPDIFIAHADLNFAVDSRTFEALVPPAGGDPRLNPMQQLVYFFYTLPQITIGKVAGFARGLGNEFLMSLDMRFADVDKAHFSQVETSLGVLPGGGGATYLTRLAGQSRALEAIVSGELFDAATAERWFWINRAFSSEQLDPFVEKLADRLGKLPGTVCRAVKASLHWSDTLILQSLAQENLQLPKVFPSEAAARYAEAAIKSGMQTPDGERKVESILQSVLDELKK